MTTKRLVALIVAAILTASSCLGGGVGGTGSITGFGSIFVNGTEWFIDSAEISLDGEEGTEADLQLGMIVSFRGRPGEEPGTATASRVVFDDSIEGPIADIQVTSADTKTVSILSQDVLVSRQSTHFDDTDSAFDFDNLDIDDVLEVSGHTDGAGVIHATWLRRLGVLVLGTTGVELEGVVSGLAGSGSFQLGSVVVEITSETDLSDIDSLENGLAVEVEGILTAPLTVLASSIASPEGLPEGLRDLSLEGIVTDFVSLADFRVVGQRVDATGAEFDPPDSSLLGPGMLIQVEGAVWQGVLIANEVRFVEDEVEIRAAVALDSDVDPGVGQVNLLGVRVQLAANAVVVDERDGVEPFGLQEVAAGDFLLVRGVAAPGSGVIATELRRAPVDNILLRGPVTHVDGATPELSVLGVPVLLDEWTETGGSLAAFLSEALVGVRVEVVDERDSDDSSIDFADEVEVAE
jgi:hypothetical protein